VADPLARSFSYDDNLFATGISIDDYANLAQDHCTARQSGDHRSISTSSTPSSSPCRSAAKVIDVNTRLATPGIIWIPNDFPDDFAGSTLL
jgi:hypothetical protein